MSTYLEAVILAGGSGTRLRQIVPHLPKPMAEIAGRPFLEILLSSLAKKKFSRVILSVGFMAEKIIEHFGHQFSGMSLIYAVEDKPLGTGGALRFALSQATQDHVFIFNGDTYLDLEVEAVEAQWQQNCLPIIVGREMQDQDISRYGRLLTDGKQVYGFAEKVTRSLLESLENEDKSQMSLQELKVVNAGCYVLPKVVLDTYPPNIPFSLETDYFSKIIGQMPFKLFISAGYFIDIGVPEEYLRAQRELINR